MANFGNALQLALGSVGAGIGGYQRAQAQREEEERLRRAEERQAKMDLQAKERQDILDALAARQEERAAFGAQGKMLPAETFAQYTMPGATPMRPALTQTIGGKQAVFSPEIERAEAHREDVMKERAARAKRAAEQTAVGEALSAVEVGGKRLFTDEQSAKYGKLPSNERSSVVSAAIRAATPPRERTSGLTPYQQMQIDKEEAAAEAMFNTPMASDSPLRQVLGKSFVNLRESNPTARPQELMRSAVAAAKAIKAPLAPAKPQAGGADSRAEEIAALRREVAARSGKPVAPAAKPAAPTAAAQPTMADAADKQARRADRWDQIKTQNPGMSDEAITAQVKREIP